MTKARTGARLLASALLWWGGNNLVMAATPSAADVLRFRPKQETVTCSNPGPAEQANCTVELIKGAKQASGWVVRDARGQVLRRFFDSNGDKQIDVYSYYLDGVEVYREIDSNFDQKIDQYRWLNTAGARWGVDTNQDGRIDGWRLISPEEVGQEVLQAVKARDFTRIQALFLAEAETKLLDLSAAEITRIQEKQKQAFNKFNATLTKLGNLGDKVQWIRVELGTPHCQPADNTPGKQDLIRYEKASILYEVNGKHEWLQIGELIQMGLAWRITDAPVPGEGNDAGGPTAVSPELQVVLDQLRDHDRNPPKMDGGAPAANPEVVRYNLKRADIIEQILTKVKAEEQEQWIRQEADCLSAAAQNSPEADQVAARRLTEFVARVTKAAAGSNLAAYVVFREMTADYGRKIATPSPDIAKIQEQWLDRLARFVSEYPKAEDTTDALLQLGMVSEFVGKENEAKKWYDHLAKNFAEHPLAAKAKGALRRLELEGKLLELAGPTLQGGNYDVRQAQGKVAIIYYWASWNQQSVGDFAKLKLLLNNYAGKIEVICVNLDSTAGEATAFLQQTQAPGTHLFQAGGLESPLATQYGVMVLPNLFLADKDGKVVSRTVQINGLEDEIKKLLK